MSSELFAVDGEDLVSTAPPKRRAALVSFSLELLQELLNLPPGVLLTGAEWRWDSRSLTLCVEGNVFPEVDPNCIPNYVCPMVRREMDGDRTVLVWEFPE